MSTANKAFDSDARKATRAGQRESGAYTDLGRIGMF